MHAARSKICYHGRIATDEHDANLAGLRHDGGQCRAEGTGTDDGDTLHPAHALAPRLP